MKSFKEYIKEDNVAGGGGVFGGGDSFDHGGSVGNSDFYAPGNSIIPGFLGTYTRQGKLKNRRKKRKKSKKSKKSK